MNHRYIKGILSAPKVSWEVNLYLSLRAFYREWSLGVESKQSPMIGGLHRLFAIPSFVPHIIKVALCGLTLLIIWGTSHISQISSCNSMILRVRAQSIRAIGCQHLCVIHGDLLLTSPSVECCQLVPSFSNALGVFVLVPNFWISYRVIQWKRCPSSSLLSSSSSPLSCSHRVAAASFSWILPCVHSRTYTKYCSIQNSIKLPFQQVLIHLNQSPNEGAMAILFPLLHAVQKISERATFGNSAISTCRNLRLTLFLVHWKHNFMGLLNIQIYPVVFPWACAKMDANRNFLWIDLNMLTTLILWSLGLYNASPSALSHRLFCSSK
jgi:hypothetical protein